MERSEVEAFLAIVQTGSFTRAADLLALSQPAVSRRIDLLEQSLGSPLFERLPAGARLTAAGDAFLPHARQIVAAIRDGTAAVRDRTNAERGSVSLALVGTLASTTLTTRLRDFRTAAPDVHLTLRTARSAEVSMLVQQGDVDLGLRYFADPAPALASTLVTSEPLVVVCAATSPLATRRPNSVTIDDLRGHAWVAFPVERGSSGEPFTRILEQWLIRSGLSQPDRQPSILPIDSLTAQKRLIEADFGPGLLPSSGIQEELRLGTLHQLPLLDHPAEAPVYAIARRNGHTSTAAERLLAALIDTSTQHTPDARQTNADRDR